MADKQKHKFQGDQEATYKALKKYLDSPDPEGPFVLKGYAGTGKTWIIGRAILDYYKRSSRNRKLSPFASIAELPDNVVVCAPTNKAVKILMGTIHSMVKGAIPTCRTIYSLLNIIMSPAPNSEREVLTFPDTPVPMPTDVEMIFLDESSMLSRELLDYITEHYSEYKWVFVGDPAQLPPVGEETSPVWELGSDLEMTKIVRFDNTIINLATDVRVKIRSESYDCPRIKTMLDANGNTGVIALEDKEFLDEILSGASLGLFQKRDHTRAIAWRNKRVDYLNTIIREEIWGDASKHQWVEGEPFLLAGPWYKKPSEPMPTHATDTEGKIIKIRKLKAHPEHGFPYWKIKVHLIDGWGKTIEEEFQFIPEKAKDTYFDLLSTYAEDAKKAFNKIERRKKWEKFWILKKSFVQIRYGYALTAHRAQGSTFQNVFVDSGDIFANPKQKEALSCFYVAITRAKKRVLLSTLEDRSVKGY